MTFQWSQSFTGGSTSLFPLVNRVSLQQHPPNRDVRPRDSHITCAQCTEDRLIGQCGLNDWLIVLTRVVIIVNDVKSDQRFVISKARKETSGEIIFKNPRVTSRMRNRTSLTSHANGFRDIFAQLLVLDLFLASIYLQPVDYYASLIYPKLDKKDAVKFSLTINPHVRVPLGLFESWLSAKGREAFEKIKDAEGVLRSVHNLVESITCVRDVLEKSDYLVQQPKDSALKIRLLKLKALCAERNSNAERALQALERQLEYLTKRHTIREAKAIRILTILAAFYLPLSLSVSILGMQTPFKQVAHTIKADELSGDKLGDRELNTNLLFDFLGVFILLGTCTIFIVHAIRFTFWMRSNGLGVLSDSLSFPSWMKSNGLEVVSDSLIGPFSFFQYGIHWRFGSRGGWWFRRIHVVMSWWLGPGICIVLLVTFMNGMPVDTQSAWDTTRYLFATYITGSGLLVMFYLAFYYFLCRKRLSVRYVIRAVWRTKGTGSSGGSAATVARTPSFHDMSVATHVNLPISIVDR